MGPVSPPAAAPSRPGRRRARGATLAITADSRLWQWEPGERPREVQLG